MRYKVTDKIYYNQIRILKNSTKNTATSSSYKHLATMAQINSLNHKNLEKKKLVLTI